MGYTKQGWVDGSPSTPLSAARLGHIEDGLLEASQAAEVAFDAVQGRLSPAGIASTVSESGGQYFERIRSLDPREFGAVGNGTTDDTAAIQACIDAAGANGTVELPPLPFRITATLNLLAGTELRGVGMKPSRLMVSTDITAVRASAGQGQAIRNLRVWNTFTGPRTTFDIEFISPTKPVLQDVEIDCNNGNTGTAGGVRFIKDAGVPGNSFMPQLSRVWVRNGHIVIDGVTDGKATDCYAWAPTTTGLGAIRCVNGASSWTFTDCDVVPPTGDFAGYYFHTVENIHVQGGLVDGSYADIMTGHGVRAINSFRLSIRASFWNLGRSALNLDNVRASSFVGNVISRCNKADNAYADINNVGGIGNTFIGNTHSSTVARSNPGRIYQESGAATDNVIDCNVRESGTNYYHATPVTTQGATYLGPGNRPLSAWPRVLARAVTASEAISQETVFRGQAVFVSGTGVALTLPSAASFYTGTSLTLKNTGGANVTITAASGQTVDGVASITLAPGTALTIMTSTAAAWQSVSKFTP